MKTNRKSNRDTSLVPLLMALVFAFAATACNGANNSAPPNGNANHTEATAKVSIQSFAAFTAPNIPETYSLSMAACNMVYGDGILYQLNGIEVNIIDADSMTLLRTIQLEGLDEYKIDSGFAYADDMLYVVRNNYGQPNGLETHVVAPADYVTYLDTYDMDGKLVNRLETQEISGRTSELLMQDGMAFMLSGNNGQNHIYTIDLTTKAVQQLDLANVSALTAGGAGRVLLYRDLHSRAEILVYDTVQNAVSETIDLDINGQAIMCLDEAANMLYIHNYSTLLRIDLATKVTENVYHFISGAVTNLTHKLLMADNRLVVFSLDGSYKMFSDLGNSWESDVMLTFLAPTEYAITPSIREAMVAFNELHPNFQYRVIHTGYDNYQADLAKRLMANDTDFDFYITGAQFEPGAIHAGYFEDLSAYPAISNHLDNMLSGIRALSSMDGKIIGVPYALNVPALGYNKNVFAHYGIQTPAPLLTLADYAACMTEAAPALAADKIGIGEMRFITLFGTFASNFFNGTITPTAADLSALLETSKQLYEQGVLDIESRSGIFTDLFSIPFDLGTTAMSYPRYNGEAQYSPDYRMLSVNENSANKALAIELLTILSSQDIQDSLIEKSIASRRASVEMAETPSISIEQTLNLSYLYPREAMRDNENYQMYTQILANSIRRGMNPNVYATDVFTQYAHGEITLDMATERIYRQLTMIRDE